MSESFHTKLTSKRRFAGFFTSFVWFHFCFWAPWCWYNLSSSGKIQTASVLSPVFGVWWDQTMAGAHFMSCLMPVSLIAFSGSPWNDQQVCFKTWTKPDGPNPVVYLKEPRNLPCIGSTKVLENRVWLFEVLAIFSEKMFIVLYSVWSASSTCLMWDSSWREKCEQLGHSWRT